MDCDALFDISGKVAHVTGGSGGIGYMIAEGLLSAGCTVFILSRNTKGINAAADRLSALGKVIPITADIATADGVAAAFCRHRCGGAFAHSGQQCGGNLGGGRLSTSSPERGSRSY
ncbi:MAG: SDR family NAD(P)-dependent oxidoreductase [Rhizorhabdus sp.]